MDEVIHLLGVKLSGLVVASLVADLSGNVSEIQSYKRETVGRRIGSHTLQQKHGSRSRIMLREMRGQRKLWNILIGIKGPLTQMPFNHSRIVSHLLFMMRASNFLCWAASLSLSALAAPVKNDTAHHAPMYHNAADIPGADPFVMWDYERNEYYAYSTEGADKGWNFAIYRSPDLATWTKVPGGVLQDCEGGKKASDKHGQACWARDWLWAPEIYYNGRTGWYFFFFAGRLREDLTQKYFGYPSFEEPSKIGMVVARTPTGPFRELSLEPIHWNPYDPDYYDVNVLMDEKQMLPPQTEEEGKKAPRGTWIPTIDANLFFDDDGRIYLYASRNAYRNWNWDNELGKYIEESNIIMVELERGWWDDLHAETELEIIKDQQNFYQDKPLPKNLTHVSRPVIRDGFKTILTYGDDPQEWENYHVNDYEKYNGTKKDRRWAEGSTVFKRTGKDNKAVYAITYSANNYEAANYGVGYATSDSPFGPFRKSKSNPILTQVPDGEHPIYSVGHGSMTHSPPWFTKKNPHQSKHKISSDGILRETPKGTELFYVHHGRNDTAVDRSIYTTRMYINESDLYVGSDDAIGMFLTPLDQPLPTGSYPIQVRAYCGVSPHDGYVVYLRVVGAHEAPYDLEQPMNRVIAIPGGAEGSKVKRHHDVPYGFMLLSDAGPVKEVQYQRLRLDGSWVTDASLVLNCDGKTVSGDQEWVWSHTEMVVDPGDNVHSGDGN